MNIFAPNQNRNKMKIYTLGISLLFNLLMMISCTVREKADLILTGGKIYAVDDNFGFYEAMAIKDGKILEVGDQDKIKSRYRADQVIDLAGRFVYPGFIDPHSHFIGYAMNLQRANLWMSGSMEEIVERLKEHRQKLPSEWLLGRGWDQNLFAIREMPDNTLLNQNFPDIPVYIVRVDGHAAVVNDKALELAGITSATRVDGGEVVVRDGKPTGLLIDRAMYLVSSIIPQPELSELVALLKQAQSDMFEVGLTSVCDAGLAKNQVLLLDSLYNAGELDIRVYAMLNPSDENFEYFLPKGPYQTDRLTVSSVKLFADGALGSRGALLKKSYTDDPGKLGILVDDIALMERACSLSLAHGFQVNTHCIGDSAVSLMLDMYGRYLPAGNDLRWRIEHAQVVDMQEFDKFGMYNIVPSIQAIHAVSDMGWAEDRVGPDRIKGAYAYRDLMNQTGWLPNGSDFPVEHINPLYSYHAAFTRQDSNGDPKDGWYPEQNLTREEALKGMTIWAAKANFEEHTRGSLEPGKFADFVILDEDLLSVDPMLIYNIGVVETWVNGKNVYSKPE
jgi:predicted amidohydrolase YtcJ